jgi:hypothetical protein
MNTQIERILAQDRLDSIPLYRIGQSETKAVNDYAASLEEKIGKIYDTRPVDEVIHTSDTDKQRLKQLMRGGV